MQVKCVHLTTVKPGAIRQIDSFTFGHSLQESGENKQELMRLKLLK